MRGLFPIILILILLVNTAISYLGPDPPRTDFRYLDYSEHSLRSDQEWISYTFTENSPNLEVISKEKQIKKEENRRRQAIQYEIEKDRGKKVGFRDMSEYTRYSSGNTVE